MLLKRFIYALILIASFVNIVQATGSTCLERFSGTLVSGSLPIEHFTNIAWMPDTTCFALVTDTQIRIYDMRVADEFVILAEKANEDLHFFSIAFSADANQIAYSVDNKLYRNDSQGSTHSIEFEADTILEVAFSTYRNQIAVVTGNIAEVYGLWVDYSFYLIDFDGSIADSLAIDFFPTDLNFLTENRLLLTGFQPGYEGSGSIQLYDIPSHSNLWQTQNLHEVNWELYTEEPPFAYTTIASSNPILVTGGLYGYHDYDDYYGSAFQVWNTEEQSLITRIIVNDKGLDETSRNIARLAISPDGSVIATGLSNGTIVLWDWQNEIQIAEFQTDLQPKFGLLFHPTISHYLMIYGSNADNQYNIQVWNLASIEMIYSLQL